MPWSSQNGGGPAQAGQILRHDPVADPDRVLSEREAQKGRQQREDQGFDEELGHDAASTRTERGPHRDLSSSSGRSGVEQDGDVERDDDQHEADRELHHHPRSDARVLDVIDRLGVVQHLRLQRRVRHGKCRRRALSDDGELRLRRRHRRARRQPAEHEQHRTRAARVRRRVRTKRDPVLMIHWKPEALGHHADDRVLRCCRA